VRRPPEFLEFVWLPTFEKTARDHLTDRDRKELEERLLEHPERGSLMPRTGGFRKVRVGTADGGTRGGLRVIYFYARARETIYMVMAYHKNAKTDLTERERAELKRLADTILGG
jgi:hypothetical protein